MLHAMADAAHKINYYLSPPSCREEPKTDAFAILTFPAAPIRTIAIRHLKKQDVSLPGHSPVERKVPMLRARMALGPKVIAGDFDGEAVTDRTSRLPDRLDENTRERVLTHKENFMNASPASHGKSLGWMTALLFVGALCIPSLLRAQDPPDPKPTPMITVDGSKEPEKIPEWIVWREIFRVATLQTRAGLRPRF